MQTLWKKTQAYSLLEKEISSGKHGHAYLLLYDDARNLRAAAKTFAKLFFKNGEVDVRVEKLIEEESFSDCLFYPEKDKKLSVDDAEKIKEESTLSPVEGDKKLFVISDFAEANTQTQNKLLKLLEEPPKGVIFLLCATGSYSVLTTVLSRVKKMEILPFEIEEITNCLARIYADKYDKNTLALCAAASGGSLGEAQNALEGGYYKALLESAFSLVLSPLSSLPVTVKQIADTKYKKELISLLRIVFRDALLIKTQKTGVKSLFLRSETERILKTSEAYSVFALLYAQEALTEAEKQLKFNAVFPQCIELCIANIQKNNKK